MTAYIFDLDGTLADSSHRAHHLRGPSVNRAAWERDIVSDRPIAGMVSAAQAARQAGIKVLLATSRREMCRPATVAWLSAHGIEYHALYMRPDDYDGDAYGVKSGHLYRIREHGYQPVLAFDDDPSSCLVYANAGICYCLVNSL